MNPTVSRGSKVLIENYGRLPIAMSRGEGSVIWDSEGKRYLDFFAGFGGCGVAGHSHPRIVEAIRSQAAQLLSHGNLFFSEPQIELAERITQAGFGGKVFFCHSGAEADEAALKLARLAAGPGKFKVISFENCFHGRTMGGLSLCPKSFQEGFEPMLPGNIQVPYGDLAAVEAAVDDETCAVFFEPIQGEGGIHVPSKAFVQGLRKLCDDKGLLLVCDEVWTAPGRTGENYAYQHFGIEPDVMTLAKAIGGGVPLAACVVTDSYADVLGPGKHGCTLGGNPLCAAAGVATFKLLEDEQLTKRAKNKGAELTQLLKDAEISIFEDIRGKGLMLGMKLVSAVPALDVVTKLRESGLVVASAKQNVVRLAPPLTTSDAEFEEALEILISVSKTF